MAIHSLFACSCQCSVQYPTQVRTFYESRNFAQRGHKPSSRKYPTKPHRYLRVLKILSADAYADILVFHNACDVEDTAAYALSRNDLGSLAPTTITFQSGSPMLALLDPLCVAAEEDDAVKRTQGPVYIRPCSSLPPQLTFLLARVDHLRCRRSINSQDALLSSLLLSSHPPDAFRTV
jgi:hypothetical protein